MSFRHTAAYTIVAKPEIQDCTEIARGLAELLLSDPYVYTNSEFIGRTLLHDSDHEIFIKLLFLADMRDDYRDNFFGGNAPITVEFFDRWWTLIKCDDIISVEEVVQRISSDDLAATRSSVSEPMADHVGQMADPDRRPT